ncbi:alginate lyase family protein [Sphingobacterium arenae]|uniref:Alginate lyase family protein n=1 Tax=Sphingobacterium arenae TaxID=1280598 RepID=A0ABR7Y360_9SPHI|nr:alginate lyase family protein [Sphingobacterium arenae]MBD1425739.1 alginate lyase family protein [Sphingobacterium arenae]
MKKAFKLISLNLLICLAFISCSFQEELYLAHEEEKLTNLSPVMVIPVPADTLFPRLLHTQDQLTFVRGKVDGGLEPWSSAYDDFIDKADAFKTISHHATDTVYVPKYYEDTPGHRAAKAGILSDGHGAYTTALAFSLTGDTSYAEKAIYFLNAWAQTNVAISHADDSRLIAAYGMAGLLAAADLLMGHTVWPTIDKNQFKVWLEDVYVPAVATTKAWTDNKGDWGTFAVAASYHLLEDDTKLTFEINRVKLRMDKNIASDGHMPKEVLRGVNGLWYTYFALTPITMTAQLALNRDQDDIFNFVPDTAGTLKQALDYLHYYVQHKDEWPHYPMGAGGPQDDDWPVDLLEAMNDFYDDEYETFVSGHRPIKGGYDGTTITHSGWFYPTLMKMPR